MSYLSLISEGIQDAADGIALYYETEQQMDAKREHMALYRRELNDKKTQQRIENAFAKRRSRMKDRNLSFQKDLFEDEKKMQMGELAEAKKQSRLGITSRMADKRTELNPAIKYHSNQRQLRGL